MVNITIIGAGVIGLAIAQRLSGRYDNIIVLERHDSFGKETSSRNSEVIHSGIYYPSGTMKAKFCMEGRVLLYELCQNNKIPYKKTGKLIVATEKEEIGHLDKLLAQGRSNGLKELRILSRQELKKMEPNIDGMCAAYSPETGILDSHRLMQYLFNAAKDKGAIVAYNSEVVGIEKENTTYKIRVSNNNDINIIKTRFLINCGGLSSDNIAHMAGIDIEKCMYKLNYCKGQYFRVMGKNNGIISRLVYPVTNHKSGGLGIHATLDLSGGLRLGPDAEYLKIRTLDYTVDSSKRYNFYISARKMLPFIDESELFEDMAGIRPKLQIDGGGFRDFVIKEESENGLSGFINLIGIESPGITASLAIAKYVENLVKFCH